MGIRILEELQDTKVQSLMMLTFPHVNSVMLRTINVTIALRDALLRRKCKFLDEELLRAPGVEPPRWPFKSCGQIDGAAVIGSDDNDWRP